MCKEVPVFELFRTGNTGVAILIGINLVCCAIVSLLAKMLSQV